MLETLIWKSIPRNRLTQDFTRCISILAKPEIPCTNYVHLNGHQHVPAAFSLRYKGVRYYSDNEQGDGKGKEEKSKSKLNDLLKSIVKETQQKKREAEANGKEAVVNFKLAVPVRENKRKKQQNLKKAVKNEVNTEESKNAEEEPKISPKLVAAAKSVASSLSGDSAQIESELVQKLKAQEKRKVDLKELFTGMKIDQDKSTSQAVDTDKAQRIRSMTAMLDRSGKVDTQRRPRTKYADVLFSAKPLGIFTEKKKEPTNTPILDTWDKIHEKELKLCATHPPANGFEEMILWTEQKKLWMFPINNEQGLNEEAKYEFSEHVFLDEYIKTWCPKQGPVRHFMELVTVALSKNAYLTVPEKKEYLEWYHQYFKEKSPILKSVGAEEIK